MPDYTHFDGSSFKEVYTKLIEIEKKVKEIDALKNQIQSLQSSQRSAPPVYRSQTLNPGNKIVTHQPLPNPTLSSEDANPNLLIDPVKAGIPSRTAAPGIRVYVPDAVLKHYERAKGKYEFEGSIEQYINMVDHDFWTEREKKRGWK